MSANWQQCSRLLSSHFRNVLVDKIRSIVLCAVERNNFYDYMVRRQGKKIFPSLDVCFEFETSESSTREMLIVVKQAEA